MEKIKMAVLNTEALMEKLFNWKTTVEIRGVTIYVRVVSDQSLDDARRNALLESRKLRRSLRDPNSDDYLIYLDPLNDLDDDQLRTIITNVAMRRVMGEYINTNPRPELATLGDYPTQEQQENYEAAKEQREEDYLNAMQEYVAAWQADFLKSLETKDRTYLLNAAKANRVDQVCEEKFSDVFEAHVIASSLYADEKYKNRLLTVEQYNALPTDAKQKLRDAYNSLTIGSDDIKN
jgi:hypothetical protein